MVRVCVWFTVFPVSQWECGERQMCRAVVTGLNILWDVHCRRMCALLVGNEQLIGADLVQDGTCATK